MPGSPPAGACRRLGPFPPREARNDAHNFGLLLMVGFLSMATLPVAAQETLELSPGDPLADLRLVEAPMFLALHVDVPIPMGGYVLDGVCDQQVEVVFTGGQPRGVSVYEASGRSFPPCTGRMTRVAGPPEPQLGSHCRVYFSLREVPQRLSTLPPGFLESTLYEPASGRYVSHRESSIVEDGEAGTIHLFAEAGSATPFQSGSVHCLATDGDATLGQLLDAVGPHIRVVVDPSIEAPRLGHAVASTSPYADADRLLQVQPLAWSGRRLIVFELLVGEVLECLWDWLDRRCYVAEHSSMEPELVPMYRARDPLRR